MKNLDLERLTLGEVSTIESLAGMPITAIGDENRPVGKMLAALVYVAKRRNGEPLFKFNDALALTIPESHEVLGIEDEEEEGEDEDQDAEDDGAATDPADETTPAPKAAKS